MRISTKIAQMELEVLRSRDSVYTKEDVLDALTELKLAAIDSEMGGDDPEWEDLRDCFDAGLLPSMTKKELMNYLDSGWTDGQLKEELMDCFDGETDVDIALGWASKADKSHCECNRKAFPADYIAETLERWIRVYLREHIEIDTTSIELDVEDIGAGQSVVSVNADALHLQIDEDKIVESFMKYMSRMVGK